MNTTQNALAAIQSAGSAVYTADVELRAVTQDFADQVQEAMASNPHSLDNDTLFQNWKTSARLSQMLSQLEQDLKNIYALAGQLSESDAPELRRVGKLADSKVLQIEARPAKANKTPQKLPGNATKVWAYLQTVLSDADFSKLNQSGVADPAGIARGSVGASIKNLLDAGLLEQNADGLFRLKSAK